MKPKKAKLVLENETIFEGYSFGSSISSAGEVVFNTGMVGYPETLTDPSYYGQILVFTYPLIGNYGVPNFDDERFFESDRVQIKGLIVSDASKSFNHWNAESNLSEWLEQFSVPGIYGIDTRQLTKILREKGTMLGKIIVDDKDVDYYDPNEDDLISKVCIDELKVSGSGRKKILLVDCGCKNSIERKLLQRDTMVLRVPWNADWSGIEYNGIVLSNGPGNPDKYSALTKKVKAVLKPDIPVLGICLGHQILAKTSGAKTFKLKYGHRSQNQPVKAIDGTKCFVTSQNHGFAVDTKSLKKDWGPWFENLNDGTNEGIRHKIQPWMSVQFHPEAEPGPVDTEYIFDSFLKKIK